MIEMTSTVENETLSLPQKNDQHVFKLTSLERVKIFIKTISVEPIAFLFITAKFLSGLTNENMNLEKACLVNLHYNESVCSAMAARDKTGYTAGQEASVQQLVSSMLSYTYIGSIIEIIVLLIVSGWSDKTGRRKPMFLVTFCGYVSSIVGCLFCVYFFMDLGLEFSIFFESVPSFFGSFHLLTVALYSYVAIISREKSRTVRIGAISIVGKVSMTTGIASSGILYKYAGFYGVYSVALSMYFLGLLYICFVLREPPKTQGDLSNKDSKLCSRQGILFANITKSLEVCFKSGPNMRRTKMIILQFINFVTFSIIVAELSLLYLFTRKQFGWNEVDYSVYKTYKLFLQMAGNAFSLVIFTKYLKMSDTAMGIVAVMSKIAGDLAIIFATNDVQLYIGTFSECFSGLIVISVRSLISKIVCQDEQALASSLTGILDSIGIFVMGPIYALIYYKTLSFYPAAFLWFSVSLHVPVLICFFILHRIIGEKEL